ncbi:hypothetical protein NQ317_003331 [Molorchus minor]|uniref:RNase H type-1 domain-containing protein n=1 Tax=Molorchus minor TaxID=1323400 RepID=A0ABQ9JBI6_9CUCU|nr:hypothetical protein NQ317_003331 [Molorchus minor]
MIKVGLILGIAGACRTDELVNLTVDDIEDRLFLFYKAGKCSSQPVGKNTMGKIPSVVASYLKLPDVACYTRHCLRRSSATLLADAGVDITTIKRHAGWKSTTVAEGYVENSIENKTKIANQVLVVRNHVTLDWIPGHSGQAGNEIADSLARKGAESTFIGPEPVLSILYNTAKMAVLNWSEGEILRYWQSLPVVAVVETLEHIYSKVIVIKQKWHMCMPGPTICCKQKREVLDIVEDDPSTSTREIARQADLGAPPFGSASGKEARKSSVPRAPN